jgi:hypothetical protein
MSFTHVALLPEDPKDLREMILKAAETTHVIFPAFSGQEQLPADIYPRSLSADNLGWAHSKANTTLLAFPGLKQARYFAAYAEILTMVQDDGKPHQVEIPALVVFLKGNAGICVLGLPLKADAESGSQVFLDYLAVLETSNGAELFGRLQQVSEQSGTVAENRSGVALEVLKKAIDILIDLLK